MGVHYLQCREFTAVHRLADVHTTNPARTACSGNHLRIGQTDWRSYRVGTAELYDVHVGTTCLLLIPISIVDLICYVVAWLLLYTERKEVQIQVT